MRACIAAVVLAVLLGIVLGMLILAVLLDALNAEKFVVIASAVFLLLLGLAVVVLDSD